MPAKGRARGEGQHCFCQDSQGNTYETVHGQSPSLLGPVLVHQGSAFASASGWPLGPTKKHAIAVQQCNQRHFCIGLDACELCRNQSADSW
jgi:hypothetical protein